VVNNAPAVTDSPRRRAPDDPGQPGGGTATQVSVLSQVGTAGLAGPRCRAGDRAGGRSCPSSSATVTRRRSGGAAATGAKRILHLQRVIL
jgi:hypothetical protein